MTPDDIDLWLSDLQSLPRSPELDIAIDTLNSYAQFRESQSFQPEDAADELSNPSSDPTQTEQTER